MKKYYGASDDAKPFPWLSGVVEVNGIVYLSGQLHIDDEYKLHGETIEEKFLYTMKRVEEKLTLAGLTKNDIIQIKIYLVDISQMPTLDTEYRKYFSHPMPTRTVVGVKELAFGTEIEIDVIAARD